jgi:hypothetical protein
VGWRVGPGSVSASVQGRPLITWFAQTLGQHFWSLGDVKEGLYVYERQGRQREEREIPSS